ncbi:MULTISPECIES: hypothetical protein [unclassified Paenibacillus]|uniref:hypothetical protein n=1 Tax=unclassified Paenibacillus TaxID=185978 RepID=UPI001AEB19AC|nr:MULTISPECIES: hypothetical protein [unclassified Paenibacillus]MBP1157563.1 hypothetical protein [Paenibacillus sp. PvP091]MBP1171700.1 hypothetical protein [Paenibacillus sp. PvR098]MBP2438081.1 hypothetical protein [Paenibacillus sp. PvP052]
MSSAPLCFQFDTQKEAILARDTLEEIGYRISGHTHSEMPMLYVIVDRHDLTSALEIAQAHGGRLVQVGDSPNETEGFAMAYDMEELISIPAHLVNEDLVESESEVSASAYVNRSSGAYNDDTESFDPSRDDMNGFDAGIHM